MVELTRATSVAAVIREHACSIPDRAAVIFVHDVEQDDDATQWTYAQLDAEASKIAAWLSAHLRVGDRVLLLYPNGLDFAAAFVGCLYAGMIAVPAPLPGRYRHERLRVASIAADATVAMVLTDGENLAEVTEWAAAAGDGGLPVLATDSAGLAGGRAWTLVDADHETLAMLQYTSGSTGAPKGVMVSHGNLLSNVDSQRRAWGLDEQTRWGGWIPLYHDMGLMGQLLPALLHGGSCVLMRPGVFLKQPYHWLRMIDEYDVNWSAAPDFAYALCCTRITDEQLAGLDLSRWWFAANGSEPIDATTLDAFAKRFAPAGLRDDVLCPCYGMAEATVYVSGDARRKAVLTRVDIDRLAQHQLVPADVGADLVSCGTPRDFDVVIADPRTGEALPPGAVGEIWLRGPSVCQGYWHDAVATARAFVPGGYVRTGDVGALHNGELYVTGRLQEIVNVRGRALYPQHIERELRARHTELVGVGAVFTVSLEADAEEILVVTHEVKGRPAEDQLRRLVEEIRHTIDRAFGVPVGGVGLLRRGGIRRTTSGKIQRTAMRQLFLAGEMNALHVDCAPRLAESVLSGRLAAAAR